MDYGAITLCLALLAGATPTGGHLDDHAGHVPKPETSCGPLSLAVCLGYGGRATRLEEIHDGLRGVDYSIQCTLEELRRAAENLDVAARGVRLRSEIDFLTGPAVLPVVTRDGREHFVAALAQRDDRLFVVDFPGTGHWMTDADLRNRFQWKGEALLIGAHDVLTVVPRSRQWRFLAVAALAGVVLPLLAHWLSRRAS